MTAKLLLVALVALSGPVWAQDALPTFDDFRQIDRTRRLTGQLQTTELLKVTRIDPVLIQNTTGKFPGDTGMTFAAAELLTDWPQRRAMYEMIASNSVPVALRFACAAARQGDYELALKWTQYCQERDTDNTVPWLVELWILAQQKKPLQCANPPHTWVTNFRDYTVEACQARIRLLEQAGYSPYSARRLGFKPDSDALIIARDLCKPPMDEVTCRLLLGAGESLQQHRQFLLGELIGQTLERSAFAFGANSGNNAKATIRTDEMESRRERLRERITDMERNVVDFATERQMVQYFDDVLKIGEENAMRKLASVAQPSSSTATLPTGN